MTEHYIDWPDTRDSRRKVAKELGWTYAAAEKAYKEQSAERLLVANWRKDKGFPPGRPRKVPAGEALNGQLPVMDFVGDRPPPVSVVVKDASGEPVGGGAVFAAPRVQVLIDGKPADFVTQWAAEAPFVGGVVREGGEPVYVHATGSGSLTLREDLAAQDEDGKPLCLGTVLNPPEVEKLRHALSPSAVRAVEDLEHEYAEEIRAAGYRFVAESRASEAVEYTKRIELQAKVESLQEENALLKENLSLSKSLAEVSNKLIEQEREERGETLPQTLRYADTLNALETARQGLRRLDNALHILQQSREGWRDWAVLNIVALLVAAGHWSSLPLGILGAVSAVYAGVFIIKEALGEEYTVPTPGEAVYHTYVTEPTQPACTDDICSCLPEKAPGCGHAPGTPFDVPGVLPQPPEVVVGVVPVEGATCRDAECTGTYAWEKDGDCQCHTGVAPCSACCPGLLVCTHCGDSAAED